MAQAIPPRYPLGLTGVVRRTSRRPAMVALPLPPYTPTFQNPCANE